MSLEERVVTELPGGAAFNFVISYLTRRRDNYDEIE